MECYRCGVGLGPEDPDICPDCGRRQTRTCFCGTRISRAAAVCPQCETDWDEIDRVHRNALRERKRDERSSRFQVWTCAGAAIGAALAFLGGIVWLFGR